MPTVTVRRLGALTGAYDAQGNPTRSEPLVFEVEFSAFAPGDSEESADTVGARVVDAGKFYHRGGTLDLRPSDVVTYDGAEWVIDGRPQDWPMGSVVSVRRAS